MKGKIPHTRFIFPLVKVLIDAQVSFVQVSISLVKENSIDFFT